MLRGAGLIERRAGDSAIGSEPRRGAEDARGQRRFGLRQAGAASQGKREGCVGCHGILLSGLGGREVGKSRRLNIDINIKGCRCGRRPMGKKSGKKSRGRKRRRVSMKEVMRGYSSINSGMKRLAQ